MSFNTRTPDLKTFALEEFQLVPITMGDPDTITLDKLQTVMTVVAELQNYGYTLTAADALKLAVSPNLYSFISDLSTYQVMNRLTYIKPMYPDFPTQVLAMDEAEYRFHQLLHYTSTYGMEAWTGNAVIRGWLPTTEDSVKSTPKTEEDELVFKRFRTLTLVAEDALAFTVISRLMSRKERLTTVEARLIPYFIDELSIQDVTKLAMMKIPFKENLMVIAYAFFNDAPKFQTLMRALCQHTGDVWKCTDYILTRKKYHFTTSEKKRIIRLLESYPISDFKANVILSGKKASRIIKILEYLSYNQFSKSAEHKEVVRQLRNGELMSWEAGIKANLGDKAVLEQMAKRPGMMFRWMVWLLRLGYSRDDILNAMNASALSTQTIVNTYTAFRKDDYRHPENRDDLEYLCNNLLARKLACIDTPLKGKKVYIDTSECIDFEHSALSHADKSPIPGILKSGMAYRIPDDVKVVRFFTYWNDDTRVDVDLHAYFRNADGSNGHVGWNANFRDGAVAMSGDITHSDAAEYIDVNLNHREAPAAVSFTIHDYSSRTGLFNSIETCFCGLLAVKNVGTEVKLYNPKNCIISSDLSEIEARTIDYGWLDVKNRVLVFRGAPSDVRGYELDHMVDSSTVFSLQDYMNVLIQAQGITLVDDPKDADVRLSVTPKEHCVSLTENNYWLDI